MFTTPIPIAEAVATLGAKTPVASRLRTREWADQPLALREEGFFSAGVEHARLLSTMQSKALAALSLTRERVLNGDALVDRSSFIGDLRKAVLAEGLSDGTGRLTDLASRARLGLIFDMQTQSAMGRARWKFEQDPDVLDAFPAQELLPSQARQPRAESFWQGRWDAAGGPRPTGAGRRLVALKTDPVWERISTFQRPWPPFDWGSQRELRDLDRGEAEAIGLIAPGQTVQPIDADFEARMEAGVSGLAASARDALRNLFGDQITFEGDRARWRPAA
jgi:hypothetical protein